ncbi:MAG: WYL domain-containing protein [Pseudomonadota bacterium]
MRGDQLSRQWRILRHIEASQYGLSVMDLVEMEGVTRRTVYRDLLALQEAGFPLFNEKVGGGAKWALIDTYKFQVPEPFTTTELMALHLYSDFTRAFKGTFFYDSLESLFKKVRATLPPVTVSFLERIQSSFAVGIRPYKDYGRFREMMNQIGQAIPKRRRIEIVYHALKSEKETLRKVDPYKLWFFDGTIYLIGNCHLRGEVRTFVLDRLRLLRVTNEFFDMPRDFDLDEYTRSSFKVMKGELHKVVVRISLEWARWAGEKIWHETQKARKLPNGGLELTFHVAGLEEIRSWVLSLGSEAEVMEPPELIKSILEELRALHDLYEPVGTGAKASPKPEAYWPGEHPKFR